MGRSKTGVLNMSTRRSSCLVYCSTPINLNLANLGIFTGSLSHVAETISIFGHIILDSNGGRICHTTAGVKKFSPLSPKHVNVDLKIELFVLLGDCNMQVNAARLQSDKHDSTLRAVS